MRNIARERLVIRVSETSNGISLDSERIPVSNSDAYTRERVILYITRREARVSLGGVKFHRFITPTWITLMNDYYYYGKNYTSHIFNPAVLKKYFEIYLEGDSWKGGKF